MFVSRVLSTGLLVALGRDVGAEASAKEQNKKQQNGVARGDHNLRKGDDPKTEFIESPKRRSNSS